MDLFFNPELRVSTSSNLASSGSASSNSPLSIKLKALSIDASIASCWSDPRTREKTSEICSVNNVASAHRPDSFNDHANDFKCFNTSAPCFPFDVENKSSAWTNPRGLTWRKHALHSFPTLFCSRLNHWRLVWTDVISRNFEAPISPTLFLHKSILFKKQFRENHALAMRKRMLTLQTKPYDHLNWSQCFEQHVFCWHLILAYVHACAIWYAMDTMLYTNQFLCCVAPWARVSITVIKHCRENTENVLNRFGFLWQRVIRKNHGSRVNRSCGIQSSFLTRWTPPINFSND